MKRVLLILLCHLFLSNSAAAQFQPDVPERAAFDEFTARHGTSWRVRWNERTGIPDAIFLGATRPYSGSPIEAARAFLLENRILFKMKPNLIGLEHVHTQYYRGVNHVKFQQMYEGIPVEGAEFLVHIREHGQVDMANGVYYPEIQVDLQPVITASDAISITREDFGTDGDATADLVVYPSATRYILSWRVRISERDSGGSWLYQIDAHTGTILKFQSLERHISELTSGATVHTSINTPASVPIATSTIGQGDVYATHPDLDPYTVPVALPRLDGSGYLRGTYVELSTLRGELAFELDNNFIYSPSDVRFDQVNVYYHIDRFRNNYINSLDNINLGQIQAQVAWDMANASFSPPSLIKIGNSKTVSGEPISGGNNFAFEDKIMYHEYMHAVNYHISSIAGENYGETGSIDEGLADYFAGSFTGRHTISEYAYKALTRDMTSPVISNYSAEPDWTDVERHTGGEFFSAILWDLRANIGQADADFITYQALYRITTQPDFTSYREAMLAEAFIVGNAEACAVAAKFSNRGVGDPLLVNITGPYVLGDGETGTWTADTPCTSGSNSYEWRYRQSGTSTWSGIVSTSSTYSRTMWTSDFDLKVKVTSGGQVDEDIHTITRCTNCTGGGAKRGETAVSNLPAEFGLEASYPNPFNPTTTIRFQLAEAVNVSLVVYDALGREVTRLINGPLEAGYHSRTWDATGLPSGAYTYRLTAGHFSESRSVVLAK